MDKQIHGLDLLQNPHKSKRKKNFFQVNTNLQASQDKSTNTDTCLTLDRKELLQEYQVWLKEKTTEFDPEKYATHDNDPYYVLIFSLYQLFLSQKKAIPPTI